MRTTNFWCFVFVACINVGFAFRATSQGIPSVQGLLPRMQLEEKLQKAEQKRHTDSKLQLMGPEMTMLAASGGALDSEEGRNSFLASLPTADLLRLGFTNVIFVDSQQNSWLSSVCADHYSTPDEVVVKGKPSQASSPVRLEFAPRSTCEGVKVESVFSGGASDHAGIHVGDIIRSMGGYQISTTYAITQALEAKRPGDRIDVVVVRNGQESTHEIALAGNSGSVPVSPWPTAYKRRTYQLGILLSQFKYLPYPDENPQGKIGPGCSDNPKLALQLFPPKGVITCSFFDTTSKFPSTEGLLLGDINSLTTFFFISKDGLEEPRLFMVQSEGPSDRFADMVGTFEAGFGPPTRITHESFQTKGGATFPNTAVYWDNEVSMIELENFSGTTLKYRVTHSLKPLLGVYGAVTEKDQVDKAKKL